MNTPLNVLWEAADSQRNNGNPGEALHAYRVLANQHDELGEYSDAFRAHMHVCVCAKMTNSPLAEQYFEEARAYASARNIPEGERSMLYRDQGLYYLDHGRIPEALELLNQSYQKLLKEPEAYEGRIITLAKLGYAYLVSGQLDLALGTLVQASRLTDQSPVSVFCQVTVLIHLAECFISAQDYPEALKQLKKAERRLHDSGEAWGVRHAEVCGLQALTYALIGNETKAKDMYEEMLLKITSMDDKSKERILLRTQAERTRALLKMD